MARDELKKHWSLSEEALRGLLAWLDEGVDSNGARYLEMRRRLAGYFDRKNCASPDDLADETLNRVARRLEEQGTIVDSSPPHFCYVTARFVFLESIRSADRNERSLEDVLSARGSSPGIAAPADPASEHRQTLLTCLDGCLQTLTPADRELILAYYSGERRAKIERRRELAARLDLSMNALAIRAARIRDRLERCVAGCAAEEK